jgi:hypothetical protein
VSEARPFDAIVSRILEGQAHRQLRAAAARGALPLPRTALVRLYLALRLDEEEEIRRDAETSLKQLGPEALKEVLEDPACAPEVLEHFAPQAARNEELAERITFHPSVPAAALSALAAQGNAAVIELVLTNQERLLAQPELLDRLSVNPALRADQRGRILELLDRAAKLRSRLDGAAGDGAAEGVSAEFAEAARLLDVDIGELFAASEIIDGEEFEQTTDANLRSAYRRIIMLNTAQKAILAMKGGREERMILIRDSNKIVSLSVLRNPRMTDEDAEHIARMRSVPDEVLRQLGNNREWTKSYAILAALVQNPRTPQGISTNFIPRLQNQDLKRLGSNHDVPELIRRMAKRTLELRTQKVNKLKKKK